MDKAISTWLASSLNIVISYIIPFINKYWS